MGTPVATLTVEEALKSLQKLFPKEFFRVTINEVAEIREEGNIVWRDKGATILQLSRGLDGFYNAAALEDAMQLVRTWHAEQKEK